MFGDEGDFAVVVVEAHAGEALVGNALIELQLAEVAVVDAFLGQGLVELDQQRFVFRPNGPDGDGSSVLQLPRGDVLSRVRPDGGLGQLVFRHVLGVHDDAGVQRDEAFRAKRAAG